MFSLQRLLNLWMTHTWSSMTTSLYISQCFFFPGAVYPTLYLSSYHTYRNHIPTCAVNYLHDTESPGAPFSFCETLKTRENPIYLIACKNMTYVGKQIASRRIFFFTRSNLKCSHWHGSIKVTASSSIWFFKLLQRESWVKEAYGNAWITESSFFVRGRKCENV